MLTNHGWKLCKYPILPITPNHAKQISNIWDICRFPPEMQQNICQIGFSSQSLQFQNVTDPILARWGPDNKLLIGWSSFYTWRFAAANDFWANKWHFFLTFFVIAQLLSLISSFHQHIHFTFTFSCCFGFHILTLKFYSNFHFVIFTFTFPLLQFSLSFSLSIFHFHILYFHFQFLAVQVAFAILGKFLL